MDEKEPEIRFCELAPAIEVICWIVVILAPLLRVVNGAPVTHDQFVIQVTLFTVALITAVALRIYNSIY